jgi:hypothetical protein
MKRVFKKSSDIFSRQLDFNLTAEMLPTFTLQQFRKSTALTRFWKNQVNMGFKRALQLPNLKVFSV